MRADGGGALLGGLSSFTTEIAFATESSDRLDLINYVGGASRNDLTLTLQEDGTALLWVDNIRLEGLNGIDYNDLRDGEIHSIALTWDNTNGDYAIFVDGEITDQGTGLATGETLNGFNNFGELVFGQEQDAFIGAFDPDQTFSGTLYDVRIFNEARTAPEIALNHQRSFDLSPAEAASIGLIANYQFEFDANNEVIDTVGGRNLSIQHAAGAGFSMSTPTDQLHINELSLIHI